MPDIDRIIDFENGDLDHEQAVDVVPHAGTIDALRVLRMDLRERLDRRKAG